MKGWKLVLLLLLALLIAAGVVFFSFDLVVYVYPAEMSAFSSRFSHPSFLSRGYFLLARDDTSVSVLERIKKPSLYIYMPYALRETGERSASYYIADAELVVSPFSMISSFLHSFSDERIALLYNDESSEESELYADLSQDFPSLEGVSYSGRISVVNIDSINSRIEGTYGVIYLDPLSSSELYRTSSSRIVMCEMDAVAALSLESVISLHYDWDVMIRSYLSGEIVTPYYTFSVLH